MGYRGGRAIDNNEILRVMQFMQNPTEISLLFLSWAGIEGDIYYIRDGEVKINAVNFIMTVPSRVDCLRFIWYSTRFPLNSAVSF